MGKLTWDPRYTIGIGEIDHQHGMLFRLINELSEATAKGHDRALMARVMTRLVAYIRTHFAYEERLFEPSGSPDFAEHQAIHAAFIRRFNQLDSEFRAGQGNVRNEVCAFLGEWIVEHVQGMDVRAAAHLKESDAPISSL